jgi:hypothetical protein
MNVAEIATARLIGAVFVERGILSESQIRVALEIQRETGQQLGQVLVERFGVTRQELASVVAEQWADIGRSAPPGVDAAANESWRRLGEIFVERGFVTPEQLEEALQRQRATGERVGEALVAQGSISKFELAGALAEQMSALEEAAATERGSAPPEATVVSLASRLEEPAPVVEQGAEPAGPLAPPLEEQAPAFGQMAVSPPESAPFAVQPEPESAPFDVPPQPEPAPARSPAPPVEEPLPAFGQTVASPEPLPFEPVQAEPVPELRQQTPPAWQLPQEWQPAPQGEPRPESAITSPVEEPASAFDQMVFAAAEPAPFGPESEREQDAEPQTGSAWVAFASTTAGYRLVHVDGPVPAIGETISVPDVGEVVVLRLGHSPMPNDARPCVFLEQLVRVDAAVLA